ncbi:MAG TPA: hypothetical protein VMT79_05900 [Candidatus Binatia bacterium]|nr:hypothetical protein [Candidatus Binatia bacterium]
MAALYDIAIVGGGLAGPTAGLFAARDRCRAVLFESIAAGGQVLNCEHIENFPGFPRGVARYELGPVVQQQATGLGLEVKSGEVHGATREGDAFLLSTGPGVSSPPGPASCGSASLAPLVRNRTRAAARARG